MNIAISMMANAHNNFTEFKGPLAFPQATIDQLGLETLERPHKARGLKVVAVESLPKETLVAALEWYKQNTDWSAFKRQDWVAAMEQLK